MSKKTKDSASVLTVVRTMNEQTMMKQVKSESWMTQVELLCRVAGLVPPTVDLRAVASASAKNRCVIHMVLVRLRKVGQLYSVER